MTMTQQHTSIADDVAAIRALFSELAARWNQGDGAAFGALFTDDADYIDVIGTHMHGAAAIGRAHQQMFATFFKGSVLEYMDEDADVQFIAPDVALVIHRGATRLAGQATAPYDRQSINTNLLLERDGVWRVRAFRNSRIQPFPGGPAAPGAGAGARGPQGTAR